MPNFRFTILIKQDFNRCYMVDIIPKLICSGYVQDNEKYQSFFELSVMEWGRVFRFFLCFYGSRFSIDCCFIQGLIHKITATTKNNNKTRHFNQKRTLYFILSYFKKENRVIITFLEE